MAFLDNTGLKNVFYLSDSDLLAKKIQINQLLSCADILLTDYSSVFYDFLLLNRPIGFMISDISDYSRGFIVDDPIAEMPGAKITNLEELITFLQDTISGNDNYQKERDRIKQKVFENTDSNNCYRVYKKLVQEGVLRIAQKEKLK